MRPIFFHYLRLGFLGQLTGLHFRAKGRHNTDGQPSRPARRKSLEERAGDGASQWLDMVLRAKGPGASIEASWKSGSHRTNRPDPLLVHFGLRSEKWFGNKLVVFLFYCFSPLLWVSQQSVQPLKANLIKCLEELFVFHHQRLSCVSVSFLGQGELRQCSCCYCGCWIQ